MLGHRIWKMVHPKGEDALLTSLVYGNFWHGPVFHADQKPKLNVPASAANVLEPWDPQRDVRPDRHGIYSLKDGERLWRDFLHSGRALKRTNHFVQGTIEMWGQVVEHEKGYRAEHAIVRSLHMEVSCTCIIRHIRDVVKQLEHRYDCPVTLGPLVEQLELKLQTCTPSEWVEVLESKCREEERMYLASWVTQPIRGIVNDKGMPRGIDVLKGKLRPKK